MGDEPEGTPVSKEHPFPPAGAFHTEGSVMTLLYCYWSEIDWWDNPSLCAADAYDLSGDTVRFMSRKENRPELVALARALKAADSHEFQSLRGYCASEAVARRMMGGLPSLEHVDQPVVRALRGRRVIVKLGDAHFTMQEQHGLWVITGVS